MGVHLKSLILSLSIVNAPGLNARQSIRGKYTVCAADAAKIENGRSKIEDRGRRMEDRKSRIEDGATLDPLSSILYSRSSIRHRRSSRTFALDSAAVFYHPILRRVAHRSPIKDQGGSKHVLPHRIQTAGLASRRRVR